MKAQFLISLVMLILLPSCSGKKKEIDQPPATRTESFEPTSLPARPEVPSTAPTTQAVVSARADVEGAQKNVQALLAAAQASDSPAAKAAVPTLGATNGQLSSADGKLGGAISHQAEMDEKLKQMAAAYTAREKTKDDDMARYKDACQLDLASQSKQIATLAEDKRKADAEIAKLKDEQVRKMQNIFMYIGIALTLLGVAGPLIQVIWHVPFGWVGALGLPLGFTALTISQMLPSILWWTDIALVGLVGGGVIIAAIFGYKLLHHPAPAPKAAVSSKKKAR